GIFGTVSYGWLERHFSLADMMRVGLLIETIYPSRARPDDPAGCRVGHARRVRCPRLRLGHDLDGRPSAGRTERAPWPRRWRLSGRDRWRHRDRNADRRRARANVRDHRPVLVWLHRFGDPRDPAVAPVRAH